MNIDIIVFWIALLASLLTIVLAIKELRNEKNKKVRMIMFGIYIFLVLISSGLTYYAYGQLNTKYWNELRNTATIFINNNSTPFIGAPYGKNNGIVDAAVIALKSNEELMPEQYENFINDIEIQRDIATKLRGEGKSHDADMIIYNLAERAYRCMEILANK